MKGEEHGLCYEHIFLADLAVVFKIDKVDGRERVVCDKEFPKDGFERDGLIEALPTDEGRFVCVDFGCENDDGIKVYKIIAILYCPISAKAAKKMMYSTTYGRLVTSVSLKEETAKVFYVR